MMMISKCLLLAMCGVVVACGNVAKASDAGTPDALPDALVCSPQQLLCDNACIDPTTEVAHCGGCDTACDPMLEVCQAGHCTSPATSCSAIHQAFATAPDGPYELLDGTFAFCDMTHGGVEYQQLGFAQFDAAHAGYDLVTVTDLQDPVLEKAFIYLFNRQNGAQLITSWTSGNCCFKANTTAGDYLYFGTGYIYPAHVGGAQQCSSPAYTDAFFTFFFQATAAVETLPLPTTFFTTNPASVGIGCTDGTNPAFFWKRIQP